MTYCVAARLDAGIVFLSDTRTNAGIDDIASAEKMRAYIRDGDRVIVTMRAGNMSVAQGALAWLDERAEADASAPTLWNVPNMGAAARLVGEALRAVDHRDGPALREAGVYEAASFLVGGQLAGEPHRLFHVYPAGNVLETTSENIVFQLGEFKYGKPLLDRVLDVGMDLEDGIKTLLLSMDDTMRANLSVGPPLYLVAYAADSLRSAEPARILAADPYFQELRKAWSAGLRSLFTRLPAPSWQRIEHSSRATRQ
jgi:putative proteasome-type protease